MTSQNRILHKLENPLYLPSLQELKLAFPLKQSLKTQSREFPWLCPAFTRFQFVHRYYQVYTQEYIQSFSQYLVQRLTREYQARAQTITVLEVGAGDGHFSYFLKPQLSHLIKNKQIKWEVTDNKNWEKRDQVHKSMAVERLDYQAALQRCKQTPTLVISSWMNLDVDWTNDFRKAKHVFEYILIGDVWRTAYYGAAWYLPATAKFRARRLTPHTIQGSLGRFDGSPFNKNTRTEVYAYRRQPSS